MFVNLDRYIPDDDLEAVNARRSKRARDKGAQTLDLAKIVNLTNHARQCFDGDRPLGGLEPARVDIGRGAPQKERVRDRRGGAQVLGRDLGGLHKDVDRVGRLGLAYPQGRGDRVLGLIDGLALGLGVPGGVDLCPVEALEILGRLADRRDLGDLILGDLILVDLALGRVDRVTLANSRASSKSSK